MNAVDEELSRRILVIDGAMATMIRHAPTECCDAFNLTSPGLVAEIHRRYVEAGADIITTNTFNANPITLGRYGLQHKAVEINRTGADMARKAASGRAWVAGCMGPVVGAESDEIVSAYAMQSRALIEGGVDLLLIESVIDLKSCEAALAGVRQSFSQMAVELPIMISATPTESRRLYSGETLGDFLEAMMAYRPLSVGLNCGFGSSHMLECLPELSGKAPCFISAHPGTQSESPESMAAIIGKMIKRRLVNIVGGCCGTTPAHIAAISRIT